MMWPDQGYSNEILVAAAECHFGKVPEYMRGELDMHSLCPKSTSSVENSIMILRDMEKQHT